MRVAALLGIALVFAPLDAASDKLSKFDAKTAGFALAFNGEKTAYRDRSAFLLPGATLSLEASGPPGDYTLSAPQGVLASRGPRAWQWHAPREPGLYELRVDGPAKDKIELHVFVMVPASQVRDGLLNGYRIGVYPARPLNGNPIYLPPPGFVEVTKDNQDTKVSPHFRLKQFLCKEDTSKQFPKYVVLMERLLLKLEAVLERVNDLGWHVDTLHVMSGYRTPFYNRAIGDVLYSQHQWGSAADIFIDKEEKGQMDDLNRDGRIDVNDSRYLYDVIEAMLAEPAFGTFQGGMGFYPATAAHPPFVHVDVRGTRARWKG